MSSERKDDHVRLAAAQQGEARIASNGFDDVAFVHHALAGIDAERVSLAGDLLGARWSVPLYVNAMTGGSGAPDASTATSRSPRGRRECRWLRDR